MMIGFVLVVDGVKKIIFVGLLLKDVGMCEVIYIVCFDGWVVVGFYFILNNGLFDFLCVGMVGELLVEYDYVMWFGFGLMDIYFDCK